MLARKRIAVIGAIQVHTEHTALVRGLDGVGHKDPIVWHAREQVVRPNSLGRVEWLHEFS